VFLPGLFCGLAALVARREEDAVTEVGTRGRAALFAVVVAVAVPLSDTLAPLPPAAGLIVPEMLNVWAA